MKTTQLTLPPGQRPCDGSNASGAYAKDPTLTVAEVVDTGVELETVVLVEITLTDIEVEGGCELCWELLDEPMTPVPARMPRMMAVTTSAMPIAASTGQNQFRLCTGTPCECTLVLSSAPAAG